MKPLRCLVVGLALPLALAPAGCVPRGDKAVVGTFDSKGTKISYFVQGKGEPVVLIHGWTSSADVNWKLPGTAALLAKDYQVIALDVRGHGRSNKPPVEEAYGPELVEDVVRLLDHLKIKKAHIVGYSMGGIITGAFLAKYPDRVLSATIGGMGWLKVGGAGQFGFSQIGKNEANPGPLALCGRSLAKLALTEDEIKSIKVPVIVLVGDDDGAIHKLYVEPLKEVRKDWQVVEIKGANHFTCIVREQFRDEIAAWLRKNSGK
jgi:pimeloyl-ACP methyl ester carboxylesterase